MANNVIVRKRIDQLLDAGPILDTNLLAVEQLEATGERLRKSPKSEFLAEERQATASARNLAQSASDNAESAVIESAEALSTANEAIDLVNALSLLDVPNGWDASTNTPAISDATGSDREAYIVSVGGARDLGSGSITFVAGDLVFFNTVWQKGPNIAPLVMSVAGRTGAIVLTQDDIASVLNKRTVLDTMLAGLTAAIGALGSNNRVISQQDLTAQLQNVAVTGNPFNIVSKSQRGNVSVNANNDLLSSLGYTTQSWQLAWPAVAALPNWTGLNANVIRYADVVIQDALLNMQATGNPTLVFDGRQYNVNLPAGYFTVPKILDGYSDNDSPFNINLNGNRCAMVMRGSGTNKAFFKRVPIDMDEAFEMSSYRTAFEKFTFQGSGSTMREGIVNGGTCAGDYSDIFFRNITTPIEARFNLYSTMNRIRTIFCGETLITSGTDTVDGTKTAHTWPGGNNARDCSQMTINGYHATIHGSNSAIHSRVCDEFVVNGGTFEGADDVPSAIKIKNLGTAIKMASVSRIHVEQRYTDAFIDIQPFGIGSVLIDNIYMQKNNNILVRSAPTGGSLRNLIIIKNIPLGGNIGNDFKIRYDDRDGNSNFSFEDVYMNGAPQNINDLRESTSWDTSGIYTVPTAGQLKLNPLLAG